MHRERGVTKKSLKKKEKKEAFIRDDFPGTRTRALRRLRRR
jgi:hypothetical protein